MKTNFVLAGDNNEELENNPIRMNETASFPIETGTGYSSSPA